mgnify:CR=1 FL=1
MKSISFAYMVLLLAVMACGTGGNKTASGDAVDEAWVLAAPAGFIVDTVSIDTLSVTNPFMTYDAGSGMYHLVADGGHMWLSSDLRLWTGPYNVILPDSSSWIAGASSVYSPEIHKHGGRYYYMASFERADAMVSGCDGKPFSRRSCSTLVADKITGPYRSTDATASLLDVRERAMHPTFCTDEYGVGYMIYNHDASQNGDGTVQIVRLTEDFGRRMGEAYVMFQASMLSWSRSMVNGEASFSPVMESPDLFITEGGRMGIMFTSRIGEEKAIGVAYSETGHLDGPWVMEPAPLMSGNVGNANMFHDYDGTLVLVAHKDTVIAGVERTVLQLFKMDSQFEKLQVKGNYKF